MLRKFSRFKLTLRVLPRAIVYIWKYVIHELLEWGMGLCDCLEWKYTGQLFKV